MKILSLLKALHALDISPLNFSKISNNYLRGMKDPRYQTIRGLLIEGEIKKFTDIFKWIPYSVLAVEYSTNHTRMRKMIADPSLWTLEEIYKLADLIEYNRKKLLFMAADEGDAIRKEKGRG